MIYRATNEFLTFGNRRYSYLPNRTDEVAAAKCLSTRLDVFPFNIDLSIDQSGRLREVTQDFDGGGSLGKAAGPVISLSS